MEVDLKNRIGAELFQQDLFPLSFALHHGIKVNTEITRTGVGDIGIETFAADADIPETNL